MDFLPTPAAFAAFSLATLLLTLTPGPDMTFFVSRALAEGRAAGLAAMFGAVSGIVIHTSLVALGLSALIVASPEAFFILRTAGALYLVWLAVQAIRHGSAFTVSAQGSRRRSLLANWAQGLGINLLNPKIIIFFMTFLPQFVSPGDPAAAGKLFFLGCVFVVIALPITVPMVLAADRFATWLKAHRKVMRAIDYLFAGVFSAFAVRLLLTHSR